MSLSNVVTQCFVTPLFREVPQAVCCRVCTLSVYILSVGHIRSATVLTADVLDIHLYLGPAGYPAIFYQGN